MTEEAAEYTGWGCIGDLLRRGARKPFMLRQMQNQSEEFAPHTNDPQRSVGLSIYYEVLKKNADDRSVEDKAVIATKSQRISGGLE